MLCFVTLRAIAKILLFEIKYLNMIDEWSDVTCMWCVCSWQDDQPWHHHGDAVHKRKVLWSACIHGSDEKSGNT